MIETISAAQYQDMLRAESKGRSNKYNARHAWRCDTCNLTLAKKPIRGWVCLACGGDTYIRFDSQAEARHWDSRVQLQRLGKITHLKRQVVMPVTINGVTVGTYLADFTYFDSEGIQQIDDVKGKDTALSKFKRRCVEALKGIRINLIKIS